MFHGNSWEWGLYHCEYKIYIYIVTYIYYYYSIPQDAHTVPFDLRDRCATSSLAPGAAILDDARHAMEPTVMAIY